MKLRCVMPRSYALSDKARSDRNAKRGATRRALLDAAKHLLAEKGHEGLSVVEVGRRAGVSHTLINTYFDGKAGLLAALVEEFNAPQRQAASQAANGAGTAVDRLQAVLLAWARMDLADPRLFCTLQSHSWVWSAAAEAANRAERDGFKTTLAALIAEGRAGGTIRPGPDLGHITEALWAIYTWGLRSAAFAPGDEDRAEGAVRAFWPQIEALLLP